MQEPLGPQLIMWPFLEPEEEHESGEAWQRGGHLGTPGALGAVCCAPRPRTCVPEHRFTLTSRHSQKGSRDQLSADTTNCPYVQVIPLL